MSVICGALDTKKFFFVIILSILTTSTSHSMDLDMPRMFIFEGHSHLSLIATDLAKCSPVLEDRMKKGSYKILLPDASGQDITNLIVYLTKRSESKWDEWYSCLTYQQMEIKDIKQLIKHAITLFPKEDAAPMALLESWREKINKNPAPDDTMRSLKIDSGIPLIDKGWCGYFLMDGDRVFLGGDNIVYEKVWNETQKAFMPAGILYSFAPELVIVGIQKSLTDENCFYINTMKKIDNSFWHCIHKYCYKENDTLEEQIKELNENEYKDGYLNGLLNNYAERRKSTPKPDVNSSWLSPKFIFFGLSGVAACVIMFLCIKTYVKR